jgi:TolA-binding protein
MPPNMPHPPHDDQHPEINPEINGVDFAMQQIQLLQMQIAAMNQTVQSLQDYLIAMQMQARTAPPATNAPPAPATSVTTPPVNTPPVSTPPASPAPDVKKESKEEEEEKQAPGTPEREELRKRWALKYSQESTK